MSVTSLALAQEQTKCPRPGFKPGPLDTETSPLMMSWPPRLLNTECDYLINYALRSVQVKRSPTSIFFKTLLSKIQFDPGMHGHF